MFADVAGSTAMYENMGDDLARERISKALKTLISVTRRHNGKLVKTIGDEILVYFSDVDMAVYAAKAIQETMEDDRSPETIGVSIRIGMQYGSAILESDDIFGDTVNVAARVASMAKARQILCTQEIAFMVNNPELSNNMRRRRAISPPWRPPAVSPTRRATSRPKNLPSNMPASPTTSKSIRCRIFWAAARTASWWSRET
jgi:class 3 adenylate cyclase